MDDEITSAEIAVLVTNGGWDFLDDDFVSAFQRMSVFESNWLSSTEK